MSTKKIELTDKGWNEIVTTSIEITHFSSREPFMTIQKWISFNKKYPKIGRKRKTCNCCKNSWEKLEGGVNLIFTNKGNKSVCDECLIELKTRMTKTIIVEEFGPKYLKDESKSAKGVFITFPATNIK